MKSGVWERALAVDNRACKVRKSLFSTKICFKGPLSNEVGVIFFKGQLTNDFNILATRIRILRTTTQSKHHVEVEGSIYFSEKYCFFIAFYSVISFPPTAVRSFSLNV